MADQKDPYDKGHNAPKFNEQANETEALKPHTTYMTDTTAPSFGLSGGPKPPPGVAEVVGKQVREEEATRSVTDSKFAKFIQSKYTETNNENDKQDRCIDERGDESL